MGSFWYQHWCPGAILRNQAGNEIFPTGDVSTPFIHSFANCYELSIHVPTEFVR